MKHKIVLVNPSLSLSESFGKLAPFGNFKIPINLCYLAAVIKRAGYEVDVIDFAGQKIKTMECINRILSYNPTIVGFTAFTITINKAIHLASMIKNIKPDVVTIIGGVHLSAIPAETMKENTCFDYGVIGEGEQTIVELLRILEIKRSLHEVKGLIFRHDDGSLTINEERDVIKDLDTIPFPELNCLEGFISYKPSLHRRLGGKSIMLITSRGCPMSCTFCDRSALGRQYRHHSVPYVIELIKYFKREYNISSFDMEDENIGVDRKWISELCETIVNKDLKINWTCSMRADYVNNDIAKLLFNAGCRNISFGIESGSQKMLNNYRKNINIETVYNAIEILNKNKIDISGSFILGGPGETSETILETARFLKRTNISFFYLWYFTPVPGADCYKDIRRYGTLISDNWDDYSAQQVVFIPSGLSKECLEIKYMELYRLFYLSLHQILYHVKKMTSFNKLVEEIKFAYLFIKNFLYGR